MKKMFNEPKTKITKSKTKITKKPKKETRLNDLMFMNSWRMDEASTDFIQHLAGEALEYFADRNKTCLYEFLTESGILRKTWWGWVKKFPVLADVNEQIKTLIGVRREKQAFYKEHNANYQPIVSTLRYYHEDWERLAQDDKDKDKDDKENITIVMHPLKEETNKEPKE